MPCAASTEVESRNPAGLPLSPPPLGDEFRGGAGHSDWAVALTCDPSSPAARPVWIRRGRLRFVALDLLGELALLVTSLWQTLSAAW